MFLQYIENKLSLLNKTYKRTGDTFLLSQCINPLHDDTNGSFSINTDTGYAKCFACGYHVNKDYWVNGELSEDDLEELNRALKFKRLKEKLKNEEIGLTEVGLPVNDSEVLEGYRGLSKETLSTFGIYECHTGRLYENRVIFPMFENKTPVAFTSRANYESNAKYLHSKGFNAKDTLYPFDILKKYKPSTVVLVEGIIDCITLWELGIPSFCNFGVAYNFSTEKISKLLKCGVEEIVVAFDKDEAGKKAQINIVKELEKLEEFKVTLGELYEPLSDFYNSEYKDINEYYMKGRDEKSSTN